MEDVLRRLVDEHIELMFHAASAVARVEAAQPVVEEVLVNLTVAASAALPAGGRIDVETASVDVGPENSGAHDGIEPGSYGVVSLTATGWGIDAEIRQRLLTSEAPADEIARGYASASRAVRQAAGGLRVEEAAGESLTFTVYLPHVERAEAVERDGARNGQLPGIEAATS
jgi:hypothetical protein